MSNINFSVNKKVDVYWNKNYYKSNIQDVTDKYIAISIPVYEGRYLPLDKNDSVEVLYYEENNVYKFEGKVIARGKSNNVPQIYLAIPDNFKKIQRRNYVRVNSVEYISYIKIDKDTKVTKFTMDNNYKKAMLLDISGGGIKIKLDEKLKYGDYIYVNLDLEGLSIGIKGKIVRVNIEESNANIYGVSFIDIDDRIREKIIEFVFYLMRKQRKVALKEG